MIFACAIAAGAVLTVLFFWLLFSKVPAMVRAAVRRRRK
ncbi:hypothetical protein FHX12_004806 [Rhizobium sp. BK609]|nr:hypothetical protein [Rhizobium sp. BK098]MBB3617802.1 hypothetical protein [Rhizobium sp. BK609]MBB3683383.1 hypothetical protein [Rhizobium sp. BK612]